jgi:site-specific DNA-methyltransferase (adenine-specific)
MLSINYNPDILSCLANLSTDEVFTPPQVANDVLDMLPEDIWKDSTIRFLDPASKSGVFLREIAKRLIVGLKDEIPDQQERINHIFQKQLFGIALTELTALLSRRSVYCSKSASGKYSICSNLDTDQGNIIYRRVEHVWESGTCKFCRASENVYGRGDELETHAYEFLHTNEPKELFDMRFDVIIGNPPYHLSDSGNNVGSSPIYQLFVEQAIKLSPRYLAMIIPSRWFSGGKGLDGFRSAMLNDDRISHLIDYPITADVFPGLKVIGGVCYFLWDSKHKGHCQVTTRMSGESETVVRPLNQYDTFVRFNKAISILEKVSRRGYGTLSDKVSSQKPFGLRTYERPTGKGDIILYANKVKGKIEIADIPKNKDLLNKWKVLLSMAYGEGGETREYPRLITGKPIIAPPNSACTETYLVIGAFDTQTEAESLDSFLRTKLARFLVGLRKNTQHINKDRFKFVPELPLDQTWTNEKLYAHFNISKEEIEFIDTIIRPMDSPI